MTPWHESWWLALDFESSGKEPLEAFAVTCCAAMIRDDEPRWVREWLFVPPEGAEIPEAATAVHGVTTERARKDGTPRLETLEDVAFTVAKSLSMDCPVVCHNAPYDLTLLEAECRREGVPTVQQRLGRRIAPVIDSMVLDRHTAPFRPKLSEELGNYKLGATAVTHGLPWDPGQAHGSTYDAVTAARAARSIGRIAHTAHENRPAWVRELRTQRFDALTHLTAGDLHERQVRWADEDARSFQRWLREKAPEGRRDPNAVVDGTWPVRSAVVTL